jgi:hypothetical protein
MEVALLKQRVVHHYLPDTIDSFQIPLQISLDSIENHRLRLRLISQYEQLIQRTKSDMMAIYIRTAQAKLEEYEEKSEADFQQFNETQRIVAVDQKFTKTMCDIMKRRFKNIDERLKTLYDLKVHFFVKAPTVVKN